MRRLLKVIALALVAILLGVGWLLATPSGGGWLLHRALGERGKFAAFRGSLLSRPRIEGLVYRDETQEIKAAGLDLDWAPTSLLLGRLHVRSIKGEGIGYRQLATAPAAEEPQPPSAGPPPTLPLRIQLDQIQVNGLTFATPGGTWTLDRIQTSADTEGNRVRIARLEAAGLGATLSIRGSLELGPSYPFDAQLQWTATHPSTGPVAGAGRVQGDIHGLTISHRIERPLSFETDGRIAFADTGISLDLAGQWQGLRWPLAEQPSAVSSPEGHYRITGPVEALELTASARLEPAGAPPMDLAWSERITPTGTQDLKMQIRLPRGEAELQGDVAWSPEVHWAARLEAKDLDPSLFWPEGEGRLALSARADGGLGPDGLRTDLEISRLAGQLRGQTLEGQAAARLDDRGLQIRSLDLGTGPSHLGVTGRVDWAPALAWDLSVQTRALDPSLALPDWPGRLDLDASIQGALSEQGPTAKVHLSRLAGQLRGQALSGQGRVDYRPGDLRVEQLALASGPNRLEAQGVIADRLDLGFQLDAPSLAAAWPTINGKLTANGHLGGTVETPELETKISGAGLAFGDNRLKRLDAHATWGPQKVDLDLQAKGLQSGGLLLEKISATAAGKPEAFDTRLSLDSQAVALDARLNGGWTQGQWAGRLSALELKSPDLGPWTLEQPAALSLSGARSETQPICLARDEGRLCLEGQWSPDEASLKAKLAALPLSLIQPWIPTNARIEGEVSGDADLALKDGEPQGKAQVRVAPGRLVLDLEGDGAQPLALDFGPGNVQLTAERGDIVLSGALPLAKDPGIEGQLRIGPPDPSSDARPLSGQVQARVSDLSPLELLVRGLSEVQGGLSAQLTIGGDTARPALQGEAKVTEGGAKIPELGVALTDIQASVEGRDGEPLAIRASAHSGKGSLEAEGKLALEPEQGWPLDLHIGGERFEVARLPEAELYVTPDLSLAVKDGLITVDGTVTVPEARIEIRTPPASAVSLSSDEVIVGQEAPPPAAAGGPKVRANIQVRMGDKVQLSGQGLDARLVGALRVTSNEKRTLAQGSIEVKDGHYKAYGQDLAIERGRLIFAGPITSPSLDVRATRKSPDKSVTAILDISGSLSEPLARISSEPVLPQEEALSYLITGRGLSSGEDTSKAALLRQALLQGGLKRSQGVLDKLASGIGVDELRVQEGSTLKDSSLLLGKYLSPDLYVSYAVGLLNPQGAVVLRYQLSERLRLEAQSGQAQGLDLFYKVERD